MPRSAGVLLLAFALLAASTGCRSGAKKAIEANRVEVQAILDRAQKLSATVLAAPPVTKDGIAVDDPVVLVNVTKDDVPTAVFVYAEDLESLNAPTANADRLAEADLLLECSSLLSRGKHLSASNPNVHESVVKTYLAKCKGVRQLFVIRSRRKEAREFVGDLLAYDLASGRYLGGFALDVRSAGRRDRVTNTTTKTTQTMGVTGRRRVVTTRTSSDGYVNADDARLRSDLADALSEGIEKHLPQARYID